MSKKFNFCIGFKWPDTDAVGLYAYGTNHWYGTMEEAEDTLEFIRQRAYKDTVYYIYKLEKVDG